jgi:cyanate permease
LLLACGIALRSQLGLIGLVLGSLLSGAAIGIIGVLLPGIVKRDFSAQAGLMTGVYTMALCLGAALAAGATVPLDQLFGQQLAAGAGILGHSGPAGAGCVVATAVVTATTCRTLAGAAACGAMRWPGR